MMLLNEKEAPLVEVLLATKDGEAYLPPQLDSLIHQTYRPLRILVRDDGSRDETLSILKRYQEKYPDIFVLHDDCDANLGVVKNFFRLMELSTAEYLLFCDQDDVWVATKIEEMLFRMNEIEAENPTSPVIVHSDLIIVDANLNIRNASFRSYRGLSALSKLPDLLVQNNVTGCAMMLNRKAAMVSLPYNKAAIMHDWWVACKVLYSGGLIVHIPKTLVLYRQHEKNVIGAKRKTIASYLKNPLYLLDGIERYRAVLRQSSALGYVGVVEKTKLSILKLRIFLNHKFKLF